VGILVRLGEPADVDAAVSVFERSNLASRIHVWTHEDNERPYRLYRSRGFSPTGRTGEGEGEWSREI
jgi:hypothetical protein